ncbi:hypothetical protein [Photobacterium aquimaris]|uniref:hypothetical protein n=1 Tax=Photobacterium aquimaris TaxID=512643 RepID=UPI0007F8E832|nr:hypothetical protein AYY21_05890 [Photobacterium aquimaris]
MIKNIRFDCGSHDKNYIEKITYDNYYIRNIDIETNNNKYCSSFDNKAELNSTSVFIKKLDKNLSLWATVNSVNQQSILSLIWKGKLGQVVIRFEPIISNVIHNKYCDNCILSVISTVEKYRKKNILPSR